MLKTDVFVWLTVNYKSLNFCSVDALSAQLLLTWIILFIGAMQTIYTCRTAALHAILSFLVSLFASYDLQSHKILQFFCFQILLSKKVCVWWRWGYRMTPCPPGFATPVKMTELQDFY